MRCARGSGRMPCSTHCVRATLIWPVSAQWAASRFGLCSVTPRPAFKLRLDLIPRIPCFGVALKIGQTCNQLGFQLWRNFNRLRECRDAFPDHFDQMDSLLNRQFKNVGDGNFSYENEVAKEGSCT